MHYGRIYGAGYRATTASTVAKEMMHIHANSSCVVLLHEVHLTALSTANAVADFGVAFAATTGVAGTTAAVVAFDAGNAAGRSTVYGVAGSTNATGLTYVGGSQQACNIINGYHFTPIPENRPVLKPGARLVVRRDSTIADDVAWDCSIIFEELGG
jgi:hypothetical protein